MTRSPGSGFYGITASSIERLLAARLRGDAVAARAIRGTLSTEHRRGRCGMPASRIDVAVSRLVDALDLDVVNAEALSHGKHADVVAHLRSGQSISIEVKAQTTKTLRELVQADWIRNDTDGIARMTAQQPELQRLLPVSARERLLQRAETVDPSWTTSQLFACDLCLLVDGATRADAGVTSVAQLTAYAQSKYLVHLATDGIRAAPLFSIPLLTQALEGVLPDPTFQVNRVGVAAMYSRVSGVGREFTYHVYPTAAIRGRHKLHDLAVRDIVWTYLESHS